MDKSNPIIQMEVEVQENSILYSRSKQESGPISRSQHSLAFTVPILSQQQISESGNQRKASKAHQPTSLPHELPPEGFY